MTKKQRERLAWLEHVLADGDCGRLISQPEMNALNEERERLRALEAENTKLRAALELVLGDWTNVKARDVARAALGTGPGGGGNGWIAFADRKPGEHHERRFILVAGRGTDEAQTWYRCTAVYFPDGEVRDSHSNRLTPTHWMPLAEPPTT